MNFGRRRLLRFLALFAPTFFVLLVIYPPVIRVYEPLVLKTANAYMHQLDPPTEMATDSGGAWRALDVSNNYTRGFSKWNRGVKYLHYLSLVLVPALVIATPAPWSVRLRLLLVMLPLLFLEHTIAIIGVVRMQYCVALDRSDTLCKIGLRIANTSGQLFGASLWALLTFRYWVQDRQTPAAPVRPKPVGDPSAG